jgi:hypothetical protein
MFAAAASHITSEFLLLLHLKALPRNYKFIPVRTPKSAIVHLNGQSFLIFGCWHFQNGDGSATDLSG